MFEKEMGEKLRSAFAKSTPDILEDILRDCEQINTKGETKGVLTVKSMMEKKNETGGRSPVKRFAIPSLAIAAVLMLGVFSGLGKYIGGDKVDYSVYLDVNPSVEMEVSAKDEVLSAKAENEDGKKILEDMDLKGVDIDVAVNAVIGSMLKNGYIDELHNSVLLSVKNDDADKGEAIREALVKKVKDTLSAEGVEAAVLSQSIDSDAAEKIAEEHGLSIAKAALIEKIIKSDEYYAQKTLTNLSISELNNIISAGGKNPEGVSIDGRPAYRGYITGEEAIRIALADAGVKAGDVTKLECHMDIDDGVVKYEVEFEAGGYEYEYDIDAASGRITDREIDNYGDDDYDDDDYDDDDYDDDDYDDEDDDDDDHDDDNHDDDDDDDHDDDDHDDEDDD